MTDISPIITTWETFYLLAGTAAATLIGLLFVAISINIDLFHAQSRLDFQIFGALTFNCFFYVLLIALLFLVPGLGKLGVAIPVFLLGSLGLGNAFWQQRRARRSQIILSETSYAGRFTVPMVCLAGLVIVGLGVFAGYMQSLNLLAVVVFAFLASASVNAYNLMMQSEVQELAETTQND
jgi:hypothetical protein